MKKITLSLVAGLVLTSGVAVSNVSASEVEVSANVAMTSNYVWRGMTQNAESPAIQGGFDVSMGNFYVGTWASNVSTELYGNATAEVDLYAGYASEFSGISYDLGYLQYMYPNNTDESNWGEAYLSLGYDFGPLAVSGMYVWGIDTNDVANDAVNGWTPTDVVELGASVPLPADITLDATYGMYDEIGDYYSVSATKTYGKFDVSLAYTGMDYDAAATEDEDYVVLTVGTSF